MTLLDDLAAETAAGGRKIIPCTVCQALGVLEGDEREALAEAVKPGRLSERALIRISLANGLGFGRGGLIQHRQEGSS